MRSHNTARKVEESRDPIPTFSPPGPLVRVSPAEYERRLARLEPRQQQFVREYLVDLKATAACRRAGYTGNRLNQVGYENLIKPDIAAAIRAGQRVLAEKLEPGLTGARRKS